MKFTASHKTPACIHGRDAASFVKFETRDMETQTVPHADAPRKAGNASLRDIFMSHFMTCVFIGVVFLDFIEGYAHPWIKEIFPGKDALSTLGVAAINGLATAAVVYLISLERAIRRRRKTLILFATLSTKERRRATGIAFITGVSIASLYLSSWGLPLICLILGVVILRLREFFRRVTRMLRPGRAITWEDAGYLIQIYVTLLVAFTMLNITLQWISEALPNVPPAFNAIQGRHFLIDALYFSVSLMTTVGFGDIHAISPLGKAFVAFECLTSYFTLALIIGAITRGVAQPVQERDLKKPAPPGENTPGTPDSPSAP